MSITKTSSPDLPVLFSVIFMSHPKQNVLSKSHERKDFFSFRFLSFFSIVFCLFFSAKTRRMTFVSEHFLRETTWHVSQQRPEFFILSFFFIASISTGKTIVRCINQHKDTSELFVSTYSFHVIDVSFQTIHLLLVLGDENK